MFITIVLPKADTKFNFVTVEKEEAPVPKEILLTQNVNIDHHPQKKQIRLPKLKDGETRELEFGNSGAYCILRNIL